MKTTTCAICQDLVGVDHVFRMTEDECRASRRAEFGTAKPDWDLCDVCYRRNKLITAQNKLDRALYAWDRESDENSAKNYADEALWLICETFPEFSYAWTPRPEK
jgi:hypothetical protein